MADPTCFQDAAAFRAWLAANAHEASGLLVGVRKRIDDARYTIRFTPTKPGSIWSAVNVDKIASLIEACAAGRRMG